MPNAYLTKLSSEQNISLSELEKKWAEAKLKAKEANQENNYAYVVSIFKNMIGLKESDIIPFSIFRLLN